MLARERYAWAWLLGLLIAPTLYFLALWSGVPDTGGRLLAKFGLLAAALLSLAVAALLGRFWVNRRDPDAVWFTADERDRRIEAHACAVAYQVLIYAMCVVGFIMPFSYGAWDLVHGAFLSIVLSEVVRSVLVLKAYRRGFNG